MKKSVVPVIGLLLSVLGMAASSQSPPYRESVTEFTVELEPVSTELTPGPLMVLDDFEDPVLESEFGGAYRWGTSHDDPVSSCEITWSPDGPLGGYLAFEYVNRSWMKLALCDFPRPIDATEYEGIEVVLWSDSSLEVELEIGTGGVAYVSPPFTVSEIPLVYRIPFKDLVAYGSHEAGIPGPHLAEVRSIAFFPGNPEGTLHVDNLALYGDGETAAPHSPENLVGRITRYASAETVPFSVRYEAQFPGHEDLRYYWTTDLHEELEEPDGLYVVSGIAAPADQGADVPFVIHSNASPFGVKLVIEDSQGLQYEWQDVGVNLPLHNETEITLDATVFLPEEDIAGVQWTAQNGDPADAVTFPIADPTTPVTTLVSEWPNVLTISCEITKQDGSTVRETIEALIYFRNGTPFAIRSVAATFIDPFSQEQALEILDQMFPVLPQLGINSVTTAINWWFGPPDEDGNWDVHPIYFPTEWPGDPRGNTVTPEQLEAYVGRAKELGFQVQVQLLQQPYRNDTQLQQDYWGTYYPLRITDEFLYGDGEGYWNMLMHYLPFFIEHGVDTVFLNAECGGMETFGGTTTRQFFRDVIEEYREAGFTGAISYAGGISDDPEPYTWEDLDPEICGIPWRDMGYVAFTYYPQLADTSDASTEVMYENAKRQIDRFIRPFSETYDKPVFVEDFYCFAFDGCAVKSLQRDPSIPVDLEESRRYHTAVLRALAEANLANPEPLVAGVTIGCYAMFPDSAFPTLPTEYGLAFPYVNEASDRPELKSLIQVFYSDKPLLAESE